MQGFIFDMDGVIIDSEPLHTKIKRKVLAHYEVPFKEDVFTAYMGRTTKQLFGDLLQAAGRSQDLLPEMVACKHKLYLTELEANEEVLPIPGIPELLKKLREKEIPLGLASSAGREVIEAVLTKFSLQGMFAVVLSGTELAASKPHPAIYLQAAKGLRADPWQCAVLEDAAAGVAAAKAAGMYCLAYRNPHSGEQDLSRADKIVADIREIDLRELLQEF